MSDGENKASPSNLVGGWVLAALWWLGGGWCDASARRRAADASSACGGVRLGVHGAALRHCSSAALRHCSIKRPARTMGPVAGIQLTPDEQWVIQKELSNLKMRLLSVEKSTDIFSL